MNKLKLLLTLSGGDLNEMQRRANVSKESAAEGSHVIPPKLANVRQEKTACRTKFFLLSLAEGFFILAGHFNVLADALPRQFIASVTLPSRIAANGYCEVLLEFHFNELLMMVYLSRTNQEKMMTFLASYIQRV